jgi:hypothetical protein
MAKKAKRFANGGDTLPPPIDVIASRPGSVSGLGIQSGPGYRLPIQSSFNTSRITGGGGGGGGGGSPKPSDSKISMGKIPTPVGKVYGLRGIPVGKGSLSVGASPFGGGKAGATASFPLKKGGKVKKMAKGGSVSSASKRGDGCATKGKTKGKMV